MAGQSFWFRGFSMGGTQPAPSVELCMYHCMSVRTNKAVINTLLEGREIKATWVTVVSLSVLSLAQIPFNVARGAKGYSLSA